MTARLPAQCPPAGSAPPVPEDEAMRLAEAGLALLAGLAASDVLRGRLRRALPLLRTADAQTLAAPALEAPFWSALIDAVTVQETRLFRTSGQMLALSALVFSGLAGLGRPARLLSAGCATGEEAWTLAVLARAAGLPAEVLGLDLCRPALLAAGRGCYPPGPPDPLRDVPEDYRHYFTQDAEGLRPRPGDAVQIGFARQNLLEPLPPGDGFDVILCRNVLIYLNDAARLQVLRNLCDRLAPGGALLLGATDLPPPALRLRPWQPDQPSLWRA
jgi:chemotaxis protein methyltransferase CheR